MRIKIPQYTWIKVVDDNGVLLSQLCTQEEMFVVTEDHKCENSASEKSPVYGTMEAAGAE
jgi:hypothetical protein